MKIIKNPEFLGYISHQQIGLHGRHPRSLTLGYQPHLFHQIPFSCAVSSLQRLQTVRTVLDLMDSQKPIWIWRRSGTWRFRTSGLVGAVDRNLQILLGVDPSEYAFEGTLFFEPGELDLITGIIFLNSLVAQSVKDDLFVVPENQGFVPWFDHDESIIIQFRDHSVRRELSGKLTRALEFRGLPTTFES